jgi:hypothetical protein
MKVKALTIERVLIRTTLLSKIRIQIQTIIVKNSTHSSGILVLAMNSRHYLRFCEPNDRLENRLGAFGVPTEQLG